MILESNATLWLAFASGVGIAAASGLRAFLPLLVVGLAGRFGWLELQPAAAWLSTTPSIIALSVATVLEILGDKIPAVDHALDLVSTVARPLTAWLGAYAVLVHWPAPLGAIVALFLGGGALALHLVKAKLRLGSTATTLGQANPFLSVAEDGTALTILIVTVVAPIVVLLIIVLLIWLIVRFRVRRPNPAASA